MEENSVPGQINISAATFERVKENYSFTYRGKIAAKNRGEIEMYFIHEKIKKTQKDNDKELIDDESQAV
jgi:class 3 adenylate cyclase